MYWMVGCPPGGSAGTSFCSGTEMSISRLAMWVSSKFLLFASASRASGVLALDLVFQHPDFFDVKFDGIAVLKIPAEFKSAAVADGAGPYEFAGHQGFILGDVRDDLLE